MEDFWVGVSVARWGKGGVFDQPTASEAAMGDCEDSK